MANEEQNFLDVSVTNTTEAIAVLLELRRNHFFSFRGQRDCRWSLGPHRTMPKDWEDLSRDELEEKDEEMAENEGKIIKGLEAAALPGSRSGAVDIYWRSKSVRRHLNDNLQQYIRHSQLLSVHSGGFPSDCWWSNLIFAHHHGVKSLLLDWTSNPLVALYFAVENILTKDTSTRGAVFAIRVDTEDRGKETKRWYDFSDVIKYFPYGEFCPSWIMINPALNTDRIARQSGKFTYHPSLLDRNLLETVQGKTKVKVRESEALIKITIGNDEHNPTEEIRKELGIMNVHHGSLFPDHDGFASYINEEWREIARFPKTGVKVVGTSAIGPALDRVRDFLR